MTAEIQPFVFEPTGQSVRAVLLDGEPWFVAKDACAALGLANVAMALRGLDDDERGVTEVDAPNGVSVRANTVSEAGLYSLILRSNRPEAKVFKRWITHEVLPALRRTGRYEVKPQFEIPQTLSEALRFAADEHDARVLAEARAAELAPAAEAYHDLMEADGTYSMGAVANMVGLGRNTMMASLRGAGVLQRDNRPYQRHAKHFKVVPQRYDADGETHATYTTYVRPSGLDLVRRTLGRPMQLSVIDGGAA
jgi:prophage antirepressor-like protein